MPATRTGRAVALRNSILAQAWYLVDNQVPPRLEDMLNAWRTEEWDFMADTTLPSSRETHGSTRSSLTTNVAHMTLIQDHAEGGKRITDVESFARALKIRQLRHMAEPRPPPHTNFLLYWLDKYYGHLRQGKRLLTSTCDFLHFDPTPAEEKVAPRSWNYVLKSIGTMCTLGLPCVSVLPFLP